MAPGEAPEIHRRLDAMRRHRVMWDDGGERVALARRVGKPELMLVAACSQDEMFAVICTQPRVQIWPI